MTDEQHSKVMEFFLRLSGLNSKGHEMTTEQLDEHDEEIETPHPTSDRRTKGTQMKFTYEVWPCRYDISDETDEMINRCLPEQAVIWSVYEVPAKTDSRRTLGEKWLADFRDQAEALMYAAAG